MLSLEELKTLEESESGGFVWNCWLGPHEISLSEDSKRRSLRGAAGAHAFGAVSVIKKFLPQGARRKCTKTRVFAAPRNSPGQNTGVGSSYFLQGIFPSQGLNPGPPHYRQIVYQMSHQGSPRILEWVAYPFSRGSSQLRNWTGVSCIAGRFFTVWATREAQEYWSG